MIMRLCAVVCALWLLACDSGDGGSGGGLDAAGGAGGVDSGAGGVGGEAGGAGGSGGEAGQGGGGNGGQGGGGNGGEAGQGGGGNGGDGGGGDGGQGGDDPDAGAGGAGGDDPDAGVGGQGGDGGQGGEGVDAGVDAGAGGEVPPPDPDPCPDREVDARGGCPASIYEVRRSVADDTRVTVLAMITAVRYGFDGNVSHLALQVPLGGPGYVHEYSGIWLDAAGAPPEALAPLRRGQPIRLTAQVATRFGQRHLNQPSFLEVVDLEGEMPVPVVVRPGEVATDGRRAERFEGVLVQVEGVEVTEVGPAPGPGDVAPTGEFVVGGRLRVNDFLFTFFPTPGVGSRFERLGGVLRFANGHSKLEPRGEEDVVRGPLRLAFGPPRTGVRVGPAATPLDADGNPLTLSIDRFAPEGGVVVALESDGPAIEVPETIEIFEGSFSATVAVRAGAVVQGVTLTARLGDQVLTAVVDSREGDPLPTAIELVVPRQVLVGAGFMVTARLDVPAPMVGLTLQTSVNPPEAAFGDPRPFVPPGAREVQTFFVAGQRLGPATLRFEAPELAGVFAEARFEVVDELPGGPLVINEIDYDTPGPDTDEFIEVFNTTNGPLPLAGLVLELIDGDTGRPYARYPLADAGAELAAGGYLVVGTPAVLQGLPGPVRRLPLGPEGLQDGAPDGARIVDALGAVLDGVSYEGFIPQVTEQRAPNDTDFGDGALGRCPNGRDTQENGADFRLNDPPTPGRANACP